MSISKALAAGFLSGCHDSDYKIDEYVPWPWNQNTIISYTFEDVLAACTGDNSLTALDTAVFCQQFEEAETDSANNDTGTGDTVAQDTDTSPEYTSYEACIDAYTSFTDDLNSIASAFARNSTTVTPVFGTFSYNDYEGIVPTIIFENKEGAFLNCEAQHLTSGCGTYDPYIVSSLCFYFPEERTGDRSSDLLLCNLPREDDILHGIHYINIDLGPAQCPGIFSYVEVRNTEASYFLRLTDGEASEVISPDVATAHTRFSETIDELVSATVGNK